MKESVNRMAMIPVHMRDDNIIRAVWSRIAALHCVMLPERMDKYFRSPHLPVLAARFMDPCQAVSKYNSIIFSMLHMMFCIAEILIFLASEQFCVCVIDMYNYCVVS